MAITLATTLRNTRADAITTFAGAAGAGAKIRIYTAAYATALVDCVCSLPLGGAASGGVLTFSAITAGTASASGTAAIARIYQSNGTTMVIEGLTVGVSASNINITNTTIATSDTVTVTSATITEGNP